MKKRRLDWLFWAGTAYLVLLVVFAIFGPIIRHNHFEVPPRSYGVGLGISESRLGALVDFTKLDSPAESADIQSDDIITSVDGRSLQGMDLDAVEALLWGPEGSSVELTVRKADATRVDLQLLRTVSVPAAPFMPPSSDFWMGTDEIGRDVFARIAYGARVSLLIGFSVQIIALIVGIFMGTLGVFAPKWIAVPVLRFTDGMFAFPDILLAILIVGLWDKALAALIIALAVTAWPAVARLSRTLIASLKDREYVTASQALGAGTFYLVRKHILPHLWGVLLAVAMIDVAAVILAESALSFLGIGIKPPMPSWGGMINTARVNMNSHPVMLLWPCLILSLTIFALNFVGDGLRTLADPKSR